MRMRGLLMLIPLLAVSCGRPAPSTADGGAPSAAGEQPAPIGNTTTSGAGDTGLVDPGSAEAAAAVLRDYYNAIAARGYTRAYSLWGDDGRASNQTFEVFRNGYRETASVRADVGSPGRIEGAAGSRYVEVPVTVYARTNAGVDQCFRGTYVMRRAVVDGATAAQRAWHIASADVASCEKAEGGKGGVVLPAEAAAVIERFGHRLASVSLLAPAATLERDIRAQYGPLVTQELLEQWLAHPADAPGRQVSSPWPQQIEVKETRRLSDDRYAVTGDVVLVTSVEVANGGAAAREPVSLTVERQADGSWRIADYGKR